MYFKEHLIGYQAVSISYQCLCMAHINLPSAGILAVSIQLFVTTPLQDWTVYSSQTRRTDVYIFLLCLC